jgi:hypothetical protein
VSIVREEEMSALRKSVMKYSLEKMKKAGLEQVTVTILLTIMPVLLAWAEMCWVKTHVRNRVEYLLSVLAEKQVMLEVALESATRALNMAKDAGVDESVGKLFPVISEAADAKMAKLVAAEDAIARELTLLKKEIVKVAKMLATEEAMEPSAEEEHAANAAYLKKRAASLNGED